MKQFLSLLLSAAFTLAPCAAIGEENASLGREVIPIADALSADRPFTFVIYDKTNDVTLFTGEYAFAE